jgi:PTS system ascorbate-specific IIA component
MIGLLILAHKNLGAGLIAAVEHTLGKRPPQLDSVELDFAESPERIDEALDQCLRKVDLGEGALILADVYGATHTNVACRRLQRGRIELVTGVNLPMLLRILNYRHMGMDDLIDKALSGGCGGIVCAGNPLNMQEKR